MNFTALFSETLCCAGRRDVQGGALGRGWEVSEGKTFWPAAAYLSLEG